MVESRQTDPQFELQVIAGLRAMLGDRKARAGMESVKISDPETFRRAMAEAEAKYAALSEEERQNPARTLNQLVSASVGLRLKMVFAGGPWEFLRAIPRALRRLLWK